MVDFDKQKSRRIRDLLYLEQCLVHAVHEEIEETLRDRPSDIIDRLRYILDESVLCDSTNTPRKVGYTNRLATTTISPEQYRNHEVGGLADQRSV